MRPGWAVLFSCIIYASGCFPCALLGDATGDGAVTDADAVAILECAVGTAVCDPATADLTGDGRVDPADALQLRAWLAGQPVPVAPGRCVGSITAP